MVCLYSLTDPTILPRVQVDKGAIKFILSGANIMCPGLTSKGAKMDTSLPENTIVVSKPQKFKCGCDLLNAGHKYYDFGNGLLYFILNKNVSQRLHKLYLGKCSDILA